MPNPTTSAQPKTPGSLVMLGNFADFICRRIKNATAERNEENHKRLAKEAEELDRQGWLFFLGLLFSFIGKSLGANAQAILGGVFAKHFGESLVGSTPSPAPSSTNEDEKDNGYSSDEDSDSNDSDSFYDCETPEALNIPSEPLSVGSFKTQIGNLFQNFAASPDVATKAEGFDEFLNFAETCLDSFGLKNGWAGSMLITPAFNNMRKLSKEQKAEKVETLRSKFNSSF